MKGNRERESSSLTTESERNWRRKEGIERADVFWWRSGLFLMKRPTFFVEIDIVQIWNGLTRIPMYCSWMIFFPFQRGLCRAAEFLDCQFILNGSMIGIWQDRRIGDISHASILVLDCKGYMTLLLFIDMAANKCFIFSFYFFHTMLWFESFGQPFIV